MNIKMTVSTNDLISAKGDVLVLLLDDNLRYAPDKRNPLTKEGMKWLQDAKDKKVWDYTFASSTSDFKGNAGKFKFVGFMPLRLGFFQEKDDQVRTAAAKVVDFARKHHFDSIAFFLKSRSGHKIVDKIVEGVTLGAYEYTEFKDSLYPIKTMKVELLVAEDAVRSAEKIAYERQAVCEAANGARDIVNRPGSSLVPEGIAAHAAKVAKKHGMEFTLLRKDDLKKGGHVGLLNVGAGSAHPPVMFAMNYRGARRKRADLALVGKGISFDTGGISLKPWSQMWEMKGDMAGSAAVIHTMEAIATLGLKQNVVGIIPSAENRPDAKAYLPGDIISYKNGVSVEVHSTDAEGRLVLADGLLWAQEKFKATTVIDVATLTGACLRALGLNYTGLMTNDQKLAAKLEKCGAGVGEKLWPLPLPVEYDELLLSSVAKIKNVGGPYAGASTAGLFLQRFIGEGVSWAHLDIAGTSDCDKKQRYFLVPGATGAMVRTLTDFIGRM